jgi:hypothetical protein
MNNIHMITDAEIASGIKLLQELIDGNLWLIEHLGMQKQTAYVIEQVAASRRLIERDEHQLKVYAAEVYRREQEYMGELMDDYMTSQENV